jgi:hypothetical protein
MARRPVTRAAVLLILSCLAFPASAEEAQWWLKPGLKVATYEFLERTENRPDLTSRQIVAHLDRLGRCDLLLVKGFQYWEGRFDDGEWGYPRFRKAFGELAGLLHRKKMKIGVFGFTDHARSYKGGPDEELILNVWKGYAETGADILMVDEETGKNGLDIRDLGLEHLDVTRSATGLPVGVFVYGPASEAYKLREIARHADVVAEMGYELFLDRKGDYSLSAVTRAFSAAVRKGAEGRCAYWTGAMVPEREEKGPGGKHWIERYGKRDLRAYFRDYLRAARKAGASGTWVHSICRLSRIPAGARVRAMTGVWEGFRDQKPNKVKSGDDKSPQR